MDLTSGSWEVYTKVVWITVEPWNVTTLTIWPPYQSDHFLAIPFQISHEIQIDCSNDGGSKHSDHLDKVTNLPMGILFAGPKSGPLSYKTNGRVHSPRQCPGSRGGGSIVIDWYAHSLRNHRPADWRRWITSIASISVKKKPSGNSSSSFWWSESQRFHHNNCCSLGEFTQGKNLKLCWTTVGKRNYFTGYGMLLHELPVVAISNSNFAGTIEKSTGFLIKTPIF